MLIFRLILAVFALINLYYIVLATKDEDANPRLKKNCVAFVIAIVLFALSFVVK